MKNNKGITLIALVITIIVLLILAGITIAMLTGENGLLTKSSNAKVTDMRATADEKVNLAIAAMNLELQRVKVTKTNFDPARDETEAGKTIIDLLKVDLNPYDTATVTNGDWVLPNELPDTTNGSVTVTYKNSQFVKANSNNKRNYTIQLTKTGIKLTGTEEVPAT